MRRSSWIWMSSSRCFWDIKCPKIRQKSPQVVKHVVKCEKWACSTLKAGKNKPLDYITKTRDFAGIYEKIKRPPFGLVNRLPNVYPTSTRGLLKRKTEQSRQWTRLRFWSEWINHIRTQIFLLLIAVWCVNFVKTFLNEQWELFENA